MIATTPKVTQAAVRKVLASAGHGAVQTDSFGGDGLLGYHTYPTPQGVIVGFTAASGQTFRFGGEAIAQMRPVMLESYARTLRDAGYCVIEYAGILRVER